ncbi:Ca2+ regulator and membrane fusion protein Fig1-domain-containing protein, partial [Achaetomium macrosporum]
DNGITSCSTNSDALAILIQETNSNDPLNMLYMAKSFHDQTIFSGLIFISIVITVLCLPILSTFHRWQPQTASDSESEREVKPFPWKPVSRAALILTFVAALFSLVAALWQHLSSAATSTMVSTLTYGTVSGTVGAGAMAFAWIATGVLFIAVIGLFLMILSLLEMEHM